MADYIARGAITLLAGKPKAGKSTWAWAASDAIAQGAATFLGRAITQTGVIYVSEEGGTTIRPKLPANIDTFHILTRDAAWPRPSWEQLIAGAVEKAKATAAGLLIIDTATYWAGLAGEQGNDAGHVTRTVAPLVAATTAGLAVVLIHHQRKSGGEHGDAVLGSGQWAASVDLILEVERIDKAPPTQRALYAVGRYPGTPDGLIVDRDPATGGWKTVRQVADRAEAAGGAEAAHRQLILDHVPEVSDPADGITYKELEDATGLGHSEAFKAAKKLIADGLIARAGEGVKSHPHALSKAPHLSVV
jgi:hypothetical protein